RWLPLQNVEDRSVRMEVGGETVLGTTAAILGDPARALHALLDIARRRRIPLRAGQVILAGAATAAVRLDEGVAQCTIDGLGTVTVKGVKR
ncbi:4-oxalocrotonate decarboxylase, partial [Streptomyces sp. NPDC002130]